MSQDYVPPVFSVSVLPSAFELRGITKRSMGRDTRNLEESSGDCGSRHVDLQSVAGDVPGLQLVRSLERSHSFGCQSDPGRSAWCSTRC
jgi:hypothetical protein